MKTNADYILPIIETFEQLGVRVSKHQADNFADFIIKSNKEAVIKALEEIKKMDCDQNYGTKPCDKNIDRFCDSTLISVCQKLAELKAEKGA
jgi:hypothetical protein